MSAFKIIGGIPLKGIVAPVPNKNSILKLIPAALLTDEPVIIHNVPMSTDVRLMLKIVKQLGGEVIYHENGTSIEIIAQNLNTFEIDPELSQKAKASVMFMAPLLHRFGKAYMPIPGGCKLGTRPLDAFIENMVQLGATYKREKGYYLEAKKLQGKKIWSWFPSVTGTENLIMLASLTPGTTEIYNAAAEPHTQDLCNMLVAMGAQIEGIGTNRVIVQGVEKLHGVTWKVIPDHLDIAAYIAAAALTKGEITIKNAIPDQMQMILQVFEKIGIRTQTINNTDIFVPANQELECQLTTRGDILEIFALPWPGLPQDLIQIIIVTALKAKGSLILNNSFQEYGMFWIEELVKLKAKVIMADPFRLITFGPTNYKGARLFAPNIIQASMALFLAALAAEGETILEDRSEALSRRYPDLVAKYSGLGAKIEEIK
ncbi:MAG: UDP-N-acetylglucosamine 1-carboxyvinyltransferase [bacterium]